jgi:hypothetical protein
LEMGKAKTLEPQLGMALGAGRNFTLRPSRVGTDGRPQDRL